MTRPTRSRRGRKARTWRTVRVVIDWCGGTVEVGGWAHPDAPGLAVAHRPKGDFSVTHIKSGYGIGPRALDDPLSDGCGIEEKDVACAFLLALAPLTNWKLSGRTIVARRATFNAKLRRIRRRMFPPPSRAKGRTAK